MPEEALRIITDVRRKIIRRKSLGKPHTLYGRQPIEQLMIRE
jgi:hypothetical protein